MAGKKTWGILICILGPLTLLYCASPTPIQVEIPPKVTPATLAPGLPTSTPLSMESTLAQTDLPSTQLPGILSGTHPSPMASDFSYLGKLDSHIQALLIDFLEGKDIQQSAVREGITASGANILVEIYVKEDITAAESCLRALGMDIKARNEANHMIEGLLPVESILQAAQCEEVKAILPVTGFGTNN